MTPNTIVLPTSFALATPSVCKILIISLLLLSTLDDIKTCILQNNHNSYDYFKGYRLVINKVIVKLSQIKSHVRTKTTVKFGYLLVISNISLCNGII